MSSATSKPQIENRIREHVITLAGTIGERNVFRLQALGAAGDYIEAIFEDQGYRVNRQEYEACDVVCANLEATLPGASRPEQILLLGAHYDSVAGSPGANDNGSGVASLLEILRLFAGTSPVLPSASSPSSTRSRRFFLTSRLGSAVYARATRRRGDDIRLMVSLETMGCYLDAPAASASTTSPQVLS